MANFDRLMYAAVAQIRAGRAALRKFGPVPGRPPVDPFSGGDFHLREGTFETHYGVAEGIRIYSAAPGGKADDGYSRRNRENGVSFDLIRKIRGAK